MNTPTRVVALVLEVAALCAFGYTAAPARDGDPALVGTVWKGKLTQKGDFKGTGGVPAEFACAFKITKRDGEKFEAELYEKTPDLELTYLVRGTIKPADKGFKIEWESVDAKDVKDTEAVTNIPYVGTLKDKKMKGTWKFPSNPDGTTLEGDFEFELTTKE
ncbi:hypothetical protein [Frigoriglobus tundricola]|uniref:Uncharacterized protein n=1 Tax=Frigoriglobus tundricola TaxID=2774151 RepID=A0A6M5YIS2_9BACT|nr:hypothetical protein [Frigoriglobus tundricola]QJW92872.1 hypothetical protein FTUN_0369 [Frigoriglobus tundricola]